MAWQGGAMAVDVKNVCMLKTKRKENGVKIKKNVRVANSMVE
jgi:hypothetical protein